MGREEEEEDWAASCRCRSSSSRIISSISKSSTSSLGNGAEDAEEGGRVGGELEHVIALVLEVVGAGASWVSWSEAEVESLSGSWRGSRSSGLRPLTSPLEASRHMPRWF